MLHNKVSFIISIDGSYEMNSNFFEHFLKDKFVQNSEIIIVQDAVYNAHLLKLLKDLNNRYSNIHLFVLNEKVGYGVANNYGVEHSTGEYLFFINTDVFAKENCFEKMLASLQRKEVYCVQPLLLWPQTNRIQCAGSIFGPYYKKHLFAGRSLSTINLSGLKLERQALTSALYAMKRNVFFEYGKFDEFYYNKLESFELSFKLAKNQKTCICLPDAIAYHSQGASRNQYYFDFYQQEAYFWSHFGNDFSPDIGSYLEYQLSLEMRDRIYQVIAICQIRSCRNILEEIGIKINSYIEINGVHPNEINLYNLLPYSVHSSNTPLLFFVENIINLSSNKHWFDTRKHQNDLVIDTFGNLLYVRDI